MKIVLYEDVSIATGFTYQQALDSMDKANKSNMGTVAEFFIRSEGNEKWSLMAKANAMVRVFLANPDQCVIEVP